MQRSLEEKYKEKFDKNFNLDQISTPDRLKGYVFDSLLKYTLYNPHDFSRLLAIDKKRFDFIKHIVEDLAIWEDTEEWRNINIELENIEENFRACVSSHGKSFYYHRENDVV